MDDPVVGVPLPNGDRVEVTAGPPPGIVVRPSPPAPTNPPAPTAGPAPVWWQGSYGAAPFADRQVVTAAAEADDCRPAPGIEGELLGGPVCYGAELQGAVTSGGPFVAELKKCLSDDRRDSQTYSGTLPSFKLVDETTGTVVRTWTQPAGYQPTSFTLAPGDCAFYLWHLALVDDAGNPIPSGHRYHLEIEHEVESPTPSATAP